MAISRRTLLTGTAATAVAAACGVPVAAKQSDVTLDIKMRSGARYITELQPEDRWIAIGGDVIISNPNREPRIYKDFEMVWLSESAPFHTVKHPVKYDTIFFGEGNGG
ncbi:MAG: twin-arginine translocation signal domain-containing protein [Gammaproteobacteria bacterium]|nr:twin-arginine translocation signal domain-containing protein [Gammaproteobacteria bacterium]